VGDVSVIFTFGGIRMRPIQIAINRIELHQKTYIAMNGIADIYDRAFTQGLEMAKLIVQLVALETKDQ
jgi:hypothetical protein